MPTLEVLLPSGRSDACKAELLGALTQATVDAVSAPVESVRVILVEINPRDFAVAGVSAAALPAPPMPMIQVLMIAGRTEAQKAALIAALTEASAHVLGGTPAGLTVILKDIPNTDFGISGKTAKSVGR